MSVRRRLAASAVLVGALLFAGCVPAQPAQSDGAEQALDDFLRALAEGQYSQALALSTLDADDLACASFAEDSPTSAAIAAPTVTAIEVDGDTASAEVAYRAPAETTVQLDLVREDDAWRVAFPDAWVLDIGFDAPVVAELTVDDTCTLPVTDAHVTVAAWPGHYRIAVTDPSGVLERWENFLYEVPAGTAVGLDGDPTAVPAVPEISLVTAQAAAAPLLGQAFTTCLAAAFASADCPAELAGTTPASDRPTSPAYATIERIWTDDGATWRFETGTSNIDATRDGATSAVEFRYTGTLGTDGAGALTIDLG